jgi:hypothetical protein
MGIFVQSVSKCTVMMKQISPWYVVICVIDGHTLIVKALMRKRTRNCLNRNPSTNAHFVVARRRKGSKEFTRGFLTSKPPRL